jgi:hypothetical protein
MSDVDKKFEPVTREDVTDGALVAGQLRALRVEMKTGFELVLERFDRFSERIAALEMHRADANARLDRHEHALADHEQRLAALEAAATKEK